MGAAWFGKAGKRAASGATSAPFLFHQNSIGSSLYRGCTDSVLDLSIVPG